MSEAGLPFMSHLVELRDRLLRMVLAVLVLLLALFPFANDIYTFVADPLMAVLPENTSMIATQVASPFLTPFKLSLVTAIFVAMPYLLYQFWAFLAPGLYKNEKRIALPILISSILLFYLGAAFAYFVVFPLVFAFLTGVAPEGVAVMTDISHYLDFVLTLFFAFGLSFEVPIATILLVLTGVTTPQQLANKRPYVIVSAFVVGMLLTPPDVISQTLLAVPVWLLFEIGVLFARILAKRKVEGSKLSPAVAVAGAAAGSTVADTADLSEDEYGYEPMTEEEMEAELNLIEEEDDDGLPDDETDADITESVQEQPEAFAPDTVDDKLEQIMALRGEEAYDRVRALLYEVLAEGNEAQIKVARNILAQMDS
jgi:sec-independent protein translocase protein TatC